MKARASERLSLHELIRVGLARQEDLVLLRHVRAHMSVLLIARLRGRREALPGTWPRQIGVVEEAELPTAAAQQLLKECQLREEWRTAREAALLQQVQGLAFLPTAPSAALAWSCQGQQDHGRPQQQGQPAAGRSQPAAFDGSRFQTLLRLQATLMLSLQDHARSDGTTGALHALCQSVTSMQEHFAACIVQARQWLGGSGTAGEGGRAESENRPSAAARVLQSTRLSQLAHVQHISPIQLGATRGISLGWLPPDSQLQGRFNTDSCRCDEVVMCHTLPWDRTAAWTKLLLLGQLGLTGSDIARLQHLRRTMAARVIHKAVRAHLQRRRQEREMRAAQLRAARAAHELRTQAATTIQKGWRGYLGRKHAAQARAAAQQVAARARVLAIARSLAARRIQAAWRFYKRRRRVARAMAASCASHSRAAHLSLAVPEGEGHDAWLDVAKQQ
ncbi:uncharacterized protein HaLaN_13624 [Haematococcus lacustris]|uniref:Uncharacterized protein n=1 Tax=Haematococcus lacustris TaxID=44745 RepID=A0A699Z3A4_HAELA|nr:uncharacterized protein HaLaN_13624 [Haematococcus lacustris]